MAPDILDETSPSIPRRSPETDRVASASSLGANPPGQPSSASFTTGSTRSPATDGSPSEGPARASMQSVYSASVLSNASSNMPCCAICQGPMNMPPSTGSMISTPRERLPAPTLSRKKLPLVIQLRHTGVMALGQPRPGEDVREVQTSAALAPPELPDSMRARTASAQSATINDATTDACPTDIVSLPCSHTFHRECFLRWLHFDNDTCPLCRAGVDLQGVEPWTWRLRNIAVRTRCSPESLRLGLRPDGWFNIQLQVVPPPGKVVSKILYVFHPAFSLNKLEVNHPPFDLVMKLVSNAVDLVIEVSCTDGTQFTFVHSLVKELCSRVYFEGIFNGTADGEKIISAGHYFEDALETYHRPKDYYGVEMEPPPRFRDRRAGNPFTRFFNTLFNG